MALIIGLFLLLIVLGVKSDGKASQARINRMLDENERADKAFTDQYVDEELEQKIRDALLDESKIPEIEAEVLKALSEMPGWEECHPTLTMDAAYQMYPKNTKKDEERRKQSLYGAWGLAKDILLANRGKVSSGAAIAGYPAHRMLDTPDDRFWAQRYYFKVEWIANTLRKQRVFLTPIWAKGEGEFNGRYYWTGSHGARVPWNTKEVLPFSHNLIELPKVDLPKPYYEKALEQPTTQLTSEALPPTAE